MLKNRIDLLLNEIEEKRFNNLDHTKELCDNLIDIAKQEQNYSILGMGFYYYGVIENINGKYMKALEKFQKSYQIFHDKKLEQLVAYPYNGIGLIAFCLEDYLEALNFFCYALEKLKIYPNAFLSIIIQNNIANVYMRLQHYKKARVYFQKARQLCSEIVRDGTLIKAILELNIAEIDRKQGNYNEAVKAIRYNVMPIFRKENYNYGLVIAYENLALCMAELQKYRKCFYYIAKSAEDLSGELFSIGTNENHFDFYLLLIQLGERDILKTRLIMDYHIYLKRGCYNRCASLCNFIIMYLKKIKREDNIPLLYEKYYQYSQYYQEILAEYYKMCVRADIKIIRKCHK